MTLDDTMIDAIKKFDLPRDTMFLVLNPKCIFDPSKTTKWENVIYLDIVPEDEFWLVSQETDEVLVYKISRS